MCLYGCVLIHCTAVACDIGHRALLCPRVPDLQIARAVIGCVVIGHYPLNHHPARKAWEVRHAPPFTRYISICSLFNQHVSQCTALLPFNSLRFLMTNMTRMWCVLREAQGCVPQGGAEHPSAPQQRIRRCSHPATNHHTL
jgi:hypothetical protein